MSLPPFAESGSLSMGVELELQLVSLSDFDLTASSPDLLALFAREGFPGNVTPEITSSMIEVCSTVQTAYEPLLAELSGIRDALVRGGDRLNIGICGGGTHPFQMWADQRIYPKPRFREVSNLYGYLAKQFTVFGQHVHIGCRNGDEAMRLLHGLNRYVPQFVALSASSPFVQGTDTLFNSARLNSVTAFPLAGRAPFVLCWQQFVDEYFTKMEKTGVVKSMKDFYWDIRPKPEYGTIELRVCDTPLTIERAAALAGYLQSLCAYLLDEQDPPPVEDDYLVYNYNRFQACRFGLDGQIVDPKRYEQLSLREDILSSIRRVASYAENLGAHGALDHLSEVVHQGSDASWLRGVFERSGSAEGMVHAAVEQFRNG